MRPDPGLRVRADLEVVVDGGELAVEREAERRIGVEHVKDTVDHVDELHPEALERPIPLAVPVRVRHEVHARRLAHLDSVARTGKWSDASPDSRTTRHEVAPIPWRKTWSIG